MKFIIGIGNPGEKYRYNRHNIGHMVIDKVKSQKLKVKSFKTDTFMNDSGSFVLGLISKYPSIPISSIYIVHDDLDLHLGTWKMQI